MTLSKRNFYVTSETKHKFRMSFSMRGRSSRSASGQTTEEIYLWYTTIICSTPYLNKPLRTQSCKCHIGSFNMWMLIFLHLDRFLLESEELNYFEFTLIHNPENFIINTQKFFERVILFSLLLFTCWYRLVMYFS